MHPNFCKGILTQNLVHLHDSRVGPDAVHRLGLLGSIPFLKHLLGLIVADGLVGRHTGSIAARFGCQLQKERQGKEGRGEKKVSIAAEDWNGGVFARLLRWILARV